MSSQAFKLKDVPSWSEVEKLLRCLERDREEIGPRDYLLLYILATTGIRTSELLSLRKEDFSLSDGTFRIRQLKRNGEFYREVIIVPKIKPELESYLAHFRPGERVFPRTRRWLFDVVGRYTEKYLGRRIRTHAFRHAFATRILEKTRDIELCRRLLGHASVTTTQQYLDFTAKDRATEVISAIGGKL